MDNYMAPEGRLILGPWNDRGLEEAVSSLGFHPTGYCEKTLAGEPRRVKRIVWIDKQG
jgi:hypothetical protein